MSWSSGWDDQWRSSGGWDTWDNHRGQDDNRAAVALALSAGDLETLARAAAMLERLARPRRATCTRCGAAATATLADDQAGELGEILAGLRAIRGKAANPRGATLWFGE